MKIAVGYIRVSGYPQLSTARKYKHSFRRQAEAINEYAERNGFEVIQYFLTALKAKPCSTVAQVEGFYQIIWEP